MVAKILLSLCLLMATCTAFPNGGPIDACVRTRANQPNHGGILPQPENTNPFIVEASTNFWRPGDVITGELRFITFTCRFFCRSEHVAAPILAIGGSKTINTMGWNIRTSSNSFHSPRNGR